MIRKVGTHKSRDGARSLIQTGAESKIIPSKNNINKTINLEFIGQAYNFIYLRGQNFEKKKSCIQFTKKKKVQGEIARARPHMASPLDRPLD